MNYRFFCTVCTQTYPLEEIRYRCKCGEVLDIAGHVNTDYTSKQLIRLFGDRMSSQEVFDQSGIWRYRELLPPIDRKYIVSRPEGNTNLYAVGKKNGSAFQGFRSIGKYADCDVLYLKHEGENPTGSFKDRGMSVGMSFARAFKKKAVACASTGNTSASLASYAAQAGLQAIVCIPAGKITYSKLSQALAYNAIIVQIDGDFDAAMQMVEDVSSELGLYLLNSINPFRLEGQKTIAYEMMQQLRWDAPDWIVVPGGNLGNTSAIGKACQELLQLGLISRLPRIAVVQAQGANPFYQSFAGSFVTRHSIQAETVATAIKIGNPVSYHRAKDVVTRMNGVVTEVSDVELLSAKRCIDASGIGCEPASATTIAGIRRLRTEGVIQRHETVCAILTGHVLKDPDTVITQHKGSGRMISAGRKKQDILSTLSKLLA